MDEYIPISMLNDFVFCPYSIYLHNVYMETDNSVFQAAPQIRGKLSHDTIDRKRASNLKGDLMALPVYSEEWGLMGKIDMYKASENMLIERKYQIKNIYKGQLYQLWAQMLCMREMGYDVKKLAFYEISTNKTRDIGMPSDDDLHEFRDFINKFRNFDIAIGGLNFNTSKCIHCIYCNLCDKTVTDNVYS